MRFLQRLRHDIAAGHGEVLTLKAGIRRHHHHVEALLERFLPCRTLVSDVKAIAAQFEDRSGFSGAEFDPPVRDEIERRDPFSDAGRMIVRGRH